MQTIRILVAGDLLPSEGNVSLFEKGDVSQLFGKEICNLFSSADLSIVNLEGPLTDSNSKMIKDGPVLKASKASVQGIKRLGVSLVALANNHITDYLQDGFLDTIKTLDEVELPFIGAGPDISHIVKYKSFAFGPTKVCISNVSETFFNIPHHNSAGANLYDEYVVCRELENLKRTHDYVIVIYHGGAEYFPYPTPQTRKRFHRMADSGADFITAQHTHCIGCEEYYGGSYLLYGQGNFLFARQRNYPMMTKEGLISELTINEDGLSVKNHRIIIDGAVIRYADNQDLSDFYERGTHINDDDYIVSLFKQTKSKEILNKYLLSSKGHFPMYRLIRHLFPKSFSQIGLMNSYSMTQCIQNLGIVQGDRRYEDMFYVWNYILDYKEK